MIRNRGFTIVEVLVAAGAMGLLSAVCFAIYAMGLKSWTKLDSKTQVMANLQITKSRISREILTAQQQSLSIPADLSGVAFLSGGPENSRQVDAGGRPVWQEFVYYYYLPAEEKLYRRTEPYATADNTLFSTIEIFTGDSLVDLQTGGQPIANDIMKFEVQLQNPDILNLVIRARAGKEEFELTSNYQLIQAI